MSDTKKAPRVRQLASRPDWAATAQRLRQHAAERGQRVATVVREALRKVHQ